MTCTVIVGYGPEGESFPEHVCGRAPAVAVWVREGQTVAMCATHDRRAQRLVREQRAGTAGWARVEDAA